MLIGFWLAGKIYNQYTIAEGGHTWKMIWIIPASIAAVVMVFYGVAFKNEKIEVKSNG